MTKKIFRSVFLIASMVLAACLSVVLGVLYQHFTSMQSGRLKTLTSLAAQGVALNGPAYFDRLNTDGYRITWVDADGTVLYDNEAAIPAADNHARREEIWEALATGAGESERYSTTLAEKTLYRAQRLPDGTVLRVSATQHSVLRLVLGMLPSILAVLAAAIALSAVLARRMSRRIVGPLNALDLDHPLENEAYEELSPLLTRIERQHRQIVSQLEELQRKQNEFSAVTDSMNEGLILLNDKGTILSMNHAAMRLFDTDGSSVGQDMLTVDRSIGLQTLLRTAFSGSHGEIRLTRGEREHQFNASPVLANGTLTGVALLVFDISEKAFAEQQRRAFSANVSHELKTPLHSIMGSAELIENGLVRPEDMPRFIGHIRTEAARLVTLIDDIIRLSQLDEGVALPKESVDMLALCNDVVLELSAESAAREVALSVSGGPAAVYGVRRLLHEIVFNLCDNAIKYNVTGGSVEVSVTEAQGDTLLTVADSGIGIPAEHQARVFERFYRVEKSHSKETGGTGLGLSIVKHAAQYHGASIELTSRPGRGTIFCVRFTQEAPPA